MVLEFWASLIEVAFDTGLVSNGMQDLGYPEQIIGVIMARKSLKPNFATKVNLMPLRIEVHWMVTLYVRTGWLRSINRDRLREDVLSYLRLSLYISSCLSSMSA